MIKISLIIIFLLLVQNYGYSDHMHSSREEIAKEVGDKHVYYGSTIRLMNLQTKYVLHSHEVSYGSGSGQQSVTGFKNEDDYNSLWTIKEGINEKQKTYLDEVKCGDIIRFEHMLTKRNLHSHQFQSPITNQQEVSGYGKDGDGDGGDDWILECKDNKVDEVLKGYMHIQLKHRDTSKYLRSVSTADYNQRTCGRNCPIEGQLEISAVSYQNDETVWMIVGGLFYLKKVPEFDWEQDQQEQLQPKQLCEGGMCTEGKVDEDGYEIIIPRHDLKI